MATTEQERDRAKVEPRYTWNLAEIFPDTAAWRAAKTRIQAEVPQIGSFAGKLGASPRVLADALDLRAHPRRLAAADGVGELRVARDGR